MVLTDASIYFQPFNSAEDVEFSQWPLRGDAGVQRIERRRYQLRKVAVEIFFGNGDDLLLAFLDTVARDAFIGSICKHSGAEDDLESFQQKMAEALDAWHDGRMSNYEYLMHLNNKSGRTINDLMQYPVMPWVIKDYTSQALSLDDPATFRDLSKPIGNNTNQ
jgi:hypothetical protein